MFDKMVPNLRSLAFISYFIEYLGSTLKLFKSIL